MRNLFTRGIAFIGTAAMFSAMCMAPCAEDVKPLAAASTDDYIQSGLYTGELLRKINSIIGNSIDFNPANYNASNYSGEWISDARSVVDTYLESLPSVTASKSVEASGKSVLEEVLLSVPETLPEDSRDRKAREALKVLDMDACDEMHPMALSGGQKQRVAIASGLSSDKEIILLDEPTSGLDYIHMRQVAEVLRMLRERGKTVLVITHDLELISCCAAHVLHLEKGTVHDNYTVGNTSISKMKDFIMQK